MGTDKALLEFSGRALVTYAHDALAGAGAERIMVVGGELDALAALGMETVPDRFPGEGPLGGVVTGLGECSSPIVVVLACDQPAVEAAVVARLVGGLESAPDAFAAVAVADGVRQVLTGAYRRSTIDVLSGAFSSGERSLRGALAGLMVVEVEIDPRLVVDLDSPEDVHRHLADHEADSAGRITP